MEKLRFVLIIYLQKVAKRDYSGLEIYQFIFNDDKIINLINII